MDYVAALEMEVEKLKKIAEMRERHTMEADVEDEVSADMKAHPHPKATRTQPSTVSSSTDPGMSLNLGVLQAKLEEAQAKLAEQRAEADCE